MPLLVNLRHLEPNNVTLKGDLDVAELELDLRDDMVRAERPLEYALEVQKLDSSLLLQGRLALTLHCQCVRCLKPFDQRLEIDPWTRHLALEGEEKAPIGNDCVDLTPYIREDILLEFPQHPLCDADCAGLPNSTIGDSSKKSGAGQEDENSSAWAALNKLKF